jgi:hypothetical protein
MMELMEMMGGGLGDMMNMFGNSTIRGFGSFCITVSETLTIAAYTTLGIAEGLETLGESLEEFTIFMEEIQADFEDMSVFLEDMNVFQEEMGGSFEDLLEVLEATYLEIEALRGKIAVVSTDVGEMIVALPLLYEEAQEIQQVTAAGVPIAYVLSAIAAVAAIIAVIFLVRLRGELRYRIKVSPR